MKDPVLRRVHRGPKSNHAIIIVPGMWTMESGCDQRWIEAIEAAGFDGTIYDFVWDSSSQTKAIETIVRRAMYGAAGIAGGGAAAPIAGAALITAAIKARADWSKLKSRAKRSGRDFLPQLIRREVPERHITLLGHSLGARVAYYSIAEGTLRPNRLIMMGGAIRRDSSKDWALVADRIPQGIVNVRNKEDEILTHLFRTAELRQNPVGRKPIKVEHPRIIDFDATDIMKAAGRTGFKNSHTHYFRTLEHLQLFR